MSESDVRQQKLVQINAQIDAILKKWNYSSAEQFLTDAEQGKLADAQMDMITVGQLLDQKDDLGA